MKKLTVIFILLICAVGTYAQSPRVSKAISHAKELFIATANGNVTTIKKSGFL